VQQTNGISSNGILKGPLTDMILFPTEEAVAAPAATSTMDSNKDIPAPPPSPPPSVLSPPLPLQPLDNIIMPLPDPSTLKNSSTSTTVKAAVDLPQQASSSSVPSSDEGVKSPSIPSSPSSHKSETGDDSSSVTGDLLTIATITTTCEDGDDFSQDSHRRPREASLESNTFISSASENEEADDDEYYKEWETEDLQPSCYQSRCHPYYSSQSPCSLPSPREQRFHSPFSNDISCAAALPAPCASPSNQSNSGGERCSPSMMPTWNPYGSSWQNHGRSTRHRNRANMTAVMQGREVEDRTVMLSRSRNRLPKYRIQVTTPPATDGMSMQQTMVM